MNIMRNIPRIIRGSSWGAPGGDVVENRDGGGRDTAVGDDDDDGNDDGGAGGGC